MKELALSFRNFKKVNTIFDTYESGNLKVSVYSDKGMLLCELTKDMGTKCPSDVAVFKDIVYSQELLGKLMGEDYIKMYASRIINNERVFVSKLTYKCKVAADDSKKVAMC